MPAAPARVLVVEDEETLRTAIGQALGEAGFAVETAGDGTDFAARVALFRPDVAVLDISLPGENGLRLAQRLRTAGNTPVLFVTARDGVDERLAAFSAGADDYIIKPFILAELVARVTAVLRRSGGLVSPTIQVADLVLDEGAATVTRAGAVIDLTGTEFRLLTYLLRNRGRTMSKTQILTQVWGYDDYDPNLVEAYVSALRRKLDVDGPRLIQTVRGIGYRMQG